MNCIKLDIQFRRNAHSIVKGAHVLRFLYFYLFWSHSMPNQCSQSYTYTYINKIPITNIWNYMKKSPRKRKMHSASRWRRFIIRRNIFKYFCFWSGELLFLWKKNKIPSLPIPGWIMYFSYARLNKLKIKLRSFLFCCPASAARSNILSFNLSIC